MRERKRVNISVDPATHDRLHQVRRLYGFRSVCELVAAFVQILLDRLGDERRFDLPDDDGAYIEAMFEELGHVQRTPDGTVPKRHNNRTIK